MILFFCGREHHQRKLAYLFNKAQQAKLRPTWIVANNAINIDPPLEIVRRAPGQHTHAYFSLKPGDDELIDERVEVLSQGLYIPDGIPPFWMTYSIREAVQVQVAMENLLESGNVEALVALHTNNFWVKMMFYLAQERNIPTFAFQEGVLRDRDQETLKKQTWAGEYVSKIFVWNTESRKQYVEAGVSPRKIKVVGPSHLDSLFAVTQEQVLAQTGSTPFLVFAPTLSEEYVGNIASDAAMLKALARAAGMHFVFEPHPFERGRYGEIEVTSMPPMDKMLLARGGNCIFVGQHSTIMQEALALGAGLIEYQETGQPILQPLSEHGAAAAATKETIAAVLSSFFEGNGPDPEKVGKYLRKQFGTDPGGATDKIIEVIKQEIARA